MMRRCACVLLLEYQDRRKASTASGVDYVHALSTIFHRSAIEIQSETCKMIDAGSRYRNLTKALGRGSVLILGQEISDSRRLLFSFLRIS